jgi:chorismate mutase/prephenate dehydratase
MTLEAIRKKIDAVDKRLLTLLSERVELAQEVSKIKKMEGLGVIDSEREKKLLVGLAKNAKSLGLPSEHIQRIWKSVIKLSRFVQQ